ncbi:unnamed protein product [Dimorphilus gyrociliatus]|uniref:Rab3 GTPase-activating protein catalytic subunit n=1 Tax=Dimorphilus gyrociliatus TaxID=2664684 RepID=A0A7I8W4A9_9ANNE|nr:unnamed protein product [Dimorphilus gyrociliatus]
MVLSYYHFPKENPELRNEKVKERYKEEELCELWEDLLDDSLDFPSREHFISKWFGLRKFVILSPQTHACAIDTEGRAKILLSSISFALSQLNCPLPVLVQLDKARRRLFSGVAYPLSAVKTEFETVHLRRIPVRYQCAEGVIDLLKEGLASKCECYLSVRFTYSFSDWPQIMCDPLPEEDESDDGDDDDELSWRTIPWGACEEVISELHLAVQWPSLSQDLFVDTPSYSDLDPFNAPSWTARLRYEDDPQCLLATHLSQFQKLLSDSVRSILSATENSPDSNVTSVLDKLTEHSVPSIGTVVTKAATRLQVHAVNSPLTERMLKKLLAYIFPDVANSSEDTSEFQEENDFERRLKSAPPGGLLWRLAIALLNVNNSYGGSMAVNHLWHEIVLELRYRWDEGKVLPVEKEKEPDSATCLLQQKLQMLNCCIEHRLRRQHVVEEYNSPGEEEDDDEFFECAEESNDQQREANMIKAEGRLRKLAYQLHKVPGEYLYVPITQEPAPLTDDALEEQARVLASLGTDQTSLRARMQSACLLSDMQAFKAANPGCVLEDFVRWYSPRDLTESGCLSTRMQVEGNLWQETWNEAKPLPVRRQKRLFDDTKEAEKVLHWAASLNPSSLAREIAAVLLNICLVTACTNLSKNSLIDKLTTKIANLSRNTDWQITQFEEICRLFLSAEIYSARKKSIRTKLKHVQKDVSDDDIEKFANDLLDNQEVKINGAAKSHLGELIVRIFSAGSDDEERDDKVTTKLPPPIAKEYVARCEASKPSPNSKVVPHRIYALITGEECRIASVCSQDTAFF